MREWLSDSKYGLVFILLAGVIAMVIASMQGCDLKKSIMVDVPRNVQAKTGAPPRISVGEAPYLQQEYAQTVAEEAAAKVEGVRKRERELAAEVSGIGRSVTAFIADKQAEIDAFALDAQARIEDLNGDASDIKIDLENDLKKLEQTAAREMERFDAEIARGEQVADVLGSLLNLGISTATDAAGASGLGLIPGGSLLITAIAGLGGIMVSKPGTSKRLKEAEDRGYDMGREEAFKSAREGVQLAASGAKPAASGGVA